MKTGTVTLRMRPMSIMADVFIDKVIQARTHRASFFFQAEDGIRDLTVTGVQTCALPISADEQPRLGRRPELVPDGRQIAFTSARDGNQQIYVMNTDGSGQTRLTNDAASDADRKSVV